MSFTGAFNAGMSSIAKSMKNSADNYKLEGKIAEQKKIACPECGTKTSTDMCYCGKCGASLRVVEEDEEEIEAEEAETVEEIESDEALEIVEETAE